ncbi:MAG: APC family permease [Micromonosporaceae bacterium]|nr:APC family permease [Micromonosporaceae bacterium]
MATSSTTGPIGLRRNAIGLREVLFQSITDMAPGAAIAASIPAGAAFAGGSLPLAVVFALIACLFTAVSIGELAGHMPAAGSLATYAAQGLHRVVGFLVAWAYVLVGVLISPLVLLQLGFTTASTLDLHTSWYPGDLWWPWTILGAFIVMAAGLYGIRTSAGLGTILGIFEIGVFVVLAVLLLVHAGSANTLSVFGTGHTPAAHHGISGVVAGSIFTILAFGGFEGAAPLAEEARDPRRTVRRAVLGATLLIGILYIFTTYAVDVAFGPDKFATFTSSGAGSWEGLAESLYGIFWLFVFLAIVNSTIANANAGVNVGSRTAFAMGRIGAFPYALARIATRRRSPYVAIVAVTAVTIAVSLGLGFGYDPVTAFSITGTAIVILLVAIYIIANIACIGYFLRRRRSDHNPVLHIVIPVLGVLAFVPAWLTALGVPIASFVTPLSPPLSYAGIAMGVWMVLGIGYVAWLSVKYPGRVADVARVHLDEQPSGEAAAPTSREPVDA